MDISEQIREAGADPLQLEKLYRASVKGRYEHDFHAAVTALSGEMPDNVLYAAWVYRLQKDAADADGQRRGINWTLAVPLSILTGLIFWLLSDVDNLTINGFLPHLFLWWSPIATMSALVFLSVTANNHFRRAIILAAGLAATAGYAFLLTLVLGDTWQAEQYIILAIIHIPLLCWAALGITVLGLKSSTEDRFAFMIKSIEVAITAGLYLIAGMAFGGITIGMFAALNINLPEIWIRLIAAGGFGLLPVLATATVYDPGAAPSEQDFNQGLSRFIATMMRLMLPLTLAVLVVYILAIPFNFRAPYENRDVLIIYNVMLFAIIGLLLGATPLVGADMPSGRQQWLRRAIISVAILVELVSLYALSAIIYRTAIGGLTLNRVTIIGWNAINIGILGWILYRQFTGSTDNWAYSLRTVFGRATNAYVVWSLILLVAVPVIFLLTG